MDRIDQLKRLSDLKAAGALTDEEFTREKSNILGAPDNTTSSSKRGILVAVVVVCLLIAGAVWFLHFEDQPGARSNTPNASVARLPSPQSPKPSSPSGGLTADLSASEPFTQVGQCKTTSIASVGTRLENTPGSGTAITYADGTPGISYDTVQEAEQSRVGDPVKVCLIELPKDCPSGDDRGKVYSAENLRTSGRWSLPDSSHTCGGA